MNYIKSWTALNYNGIYNKQSHSWGLCKWHQFVAYEWEDDLEDDLRDDLEDDMFNHGMEWGDRASYLQTKACWPWVDPGSKWCVAGNCGDLMTSYRIILVHIFSSSLAAPQIVCPTHNSPFTHAYWWQSHMVCMCIFKFQMCPSSGKKQFVWCCGYLRDFWGAFLWKKMFQWLFFSGFCGICAPLHFQNFKRPAETESKPANSQMAASRPKSWEYAILVIFCKKPRDLANTTLQDICPVIH